MFQPLFHGKLLRLAAPLPEDKDTFSRWILTPPNLLRVSVGLEHPADLIEDLTQALE